MKRADGKSLKRRKKHFLPEGIFFALILFCDEWITHLIYYFLYIY